MNLTIEEREDTRRFEQSILDASTSKAVRNRLGQFATPPDLATDIVKSTWQYISANKMLSVLEPACGTGAFVAAVLQTYRDRILQLRGFEVDGKVHEIASRLWQDKNLAVSHSDFTAVTPNADDRVDLLISNPPYSRHHHIQNSQKRVLQAKSKSVTGIQPSGLAGLYCYFVLLAHQWLRPGAVAVWLIPSEFMDVNYGQAIRDYLLRKVSLLRIHCFNNAGSLFPDALVSSSVVWFRNQASSHPGLCEFTTGQSIAKPELTRQISYSKLATTKKWTPLFSREPSISDSGSSVRLSDLFRVSRGLVTGANAFFILSERQVEQHDLPREALTPVLPSSRFIPDDKVLADQQGFPVFDTRLFLLDCNLNEDEIKANFASLHKYLKIGERLGVPGKYLCSRRKPWYMQESRPPAPIVFTYMGRSSRRNRPFRFIRNYSIATATNVYLMLYPLPNFSAYLESAPYILERVWEALNRISFSQIVREGRSYGGGLHKIEPKELENLCFADEQLQEVMADMYHASGPSRFSGAGQLSLFSASR